MFDSVSHDFVLVLVVGCLGCPPVTIVALSKLKSKQNNKNKSNIMYIFIQ